MVDLSIEYAHIYTNAKISQEQALSLDILGGIRANTKGKSLSLVVLVDDYSFPDPSFAYDAFLAWLGERGLRPDLVLRESQLIPSCDEVLRLVSDTKLREQISDYVRAKKYPCSLFIAAWYLIRLGCIESQIFPREKTATRLINILPESFKPFEEKALELIRTTPFAEAAEQIDCRYIEGRLLA